MGTDDRREHSVEHTPANTPTPSVSPTWTDYLDSLPAQLRALHEATPPDAIAAPDGRTVGVEDLPAVLTEQVAPLSGTQPRPLRTELTSPGLLAGAWRQVVFGQARAALSLVGQGLREEALINARSCLEHAVYLRHFALAVDAGQVESFMAEVTRQGRRHGERDLRYLEGLDESAIGPYRDLVAHLCATSDREHAAQQGERERRAFDFTQIKKVFDGTSGGTHFYDAYSRLSNRTHAGIASAAPYLAPALRADPPLLEQADPLPWAETAVLLCWSCWAAEEALTRFLEDGADLVQQQVSLLGRIGVHVTDS